MSQTKEKKPLSYLKVPPHNIEAEQAILGGILMNNDAMNQVMDVLSYDDFYREAHVALFDGMVQLYNRGEPIDIITLSNVLNKKDKLEKVGGTDYLAPVSPGSLHFCRDCLPRRDRQAFGRSKEVDHSMLGNFRTVLSG